MTMSAWHLPVLFCSHSCRQSQPVWLCDEQLLKGLALVHDIGMLPIFGIGLSRAKKGFLPESEGGMPRKSASATEAELTCYPQCPAYAPSRWLLSGLLRLELAAVGAEIRCVGATGFQGSGRFLPGGSIYIYMHICIHIYV